MPLRELKNPHQIEDWLVELTAQLTQPGQMILIGSGALLWYAFQRGISEPLPENSMDVDPITDSDEVARLCHDALIGSEFERKHGWHVNLMPDLVLREFPQDWKSRAATKTYGPLTLVVPSPTDLFIPKRKRNEPRDRAQEAWAKGSVCYNWVVEAISSNDSEYAVWGPYPDYDDVARFEYGRRLWRQPAMRARFLRHWTDPRHPYCNRFERQRALIEEVLCSGQTPDKLDQHLRNRGTSLRCVAREIPPVFGDFF